MVRTKSLKPINTNRTVTVETTLEDVEPLSPGGRMFHAPKFNCCIIAIIGCMTKINVEVIKDGFMHTLVKHPRFSSKLVLDANKGGKPIGWTRTNVTIDDHIIVPDLDPNMDSPDQFLEDYVSNITKLPMDFTKPLWEFHVLNLKTTDANSIGVFRIHHSMGDGISLMSLVLACTRQRDNPDELPTLHTDNKKKEKTRRSFLSCLFGWLFIFRVLWNTLVDITLFVATAIWLKDTKTPLKGAPDIEATPKRFVYRNVDLDDVLVVKKAMGVTVNDVLMGITQAGLSYYLNRKYAEIKGEQEAVKDNLPKHIRLRCTVLVNLRPTSTIKDLAEKMESGSKAEWNWGNAFGYILLPLKITLTDDSLEYILNAKTTLDKKKKSLEARCTFESAKLILKTLGLGVASAICSRVVTHSTLSFSNIVGPKEEISFYGHPIAFLAPSVYGHPQALTVHFQSYMNKMTMVLAIDEEVIPDPKRLCDDIEDSLSLVKNAVIEKKLLTSLNVEKFP